MEKTPDSVSIKQISKIVLGFKTTIGSYKFLSLQTVINQNT